MSRQILFWKPYGVLSQFTPEPGSAHRTLAQFIPVKDVYVTGRLDWDSEGLLLLTDDGKLQNRLSDPAFAHPRTYWVQVEGTAGEQELAALRAGVKVQDYTTRPAKVRLLGETDFSTLPPREVPVRFRAKIPTCWIELELTEGRNRQVRRMTASVGLPTLRLMRVKIGEHTLAGLEPGKWREVEATSRQRR